MRKVPDRIAVKLMDAAELLATQGLDDTKTEDIATATGVPKATLYYYFSGKEEVLAFLFERVLDEVELAVTRAAAGPGTSAERLRDVVRAHLQVFADHPWPSRALQLDLGRAARLPDIARRSRESFLEPVARLLAEGAADGSLRAVEHPHLTALALLGAITTSGVNAVNTTNRPSVDTVANVVSSLVLDGLTTGPTAAAAPKPAPSKPTPSKKGRR